MSFMSTLSSAPTLERVEEGRPIPSLRINPLSLRDVVALAAQTRRSSAGDSDSSNAAAQLPKPGADPQAQLHPDFAKRNASQTSFAALSAVRAFKGGLSRTQQGGGRIPSLGLTRSRSIMVGAPAGLDVDSDVDHHANHHIKLLDDLCTITVVDYSRSTFQIQEHTNATFASFLGLPRPASAKVRWIAIQGLSYADVIKPLAKAFALHPLAVEDIVHVPQRVKVDYYENHLYISMILLALDDHQKHEADSPTATTSGRSLRTLVPTLRARMSDPRRQKKVQGFMPNINKRLYMEQASLFLLRDGTVVTLFQSEGNGVMNPIISHLQKPDVLLRKSEDASLLLHAVIDGIVDHALPVMQQYGEEVADLEDDIIASSMPEANATRTLHVIANELKMLRKVFQPTQYLVHDLIRHRDREEDAAAAFLTSTARIYLEDVNDHMQTVVEDIDSLSQLCRDLIDLIFNTISHQSNSSMQVLSAISTVFLPITFIAGVYGMNWDHFPELHWHLGYAFFWIVCGVVTIVVLVFLQYMGMLIHARKKHRKPHSS